MIFIAGKLLANHHFKVARSLFLDHHPKWLYGIKNSQGWYGGDIYNPARATFIRST
jgi:hypothetical protein